MYTRSGGFEVDRSGYVVNSANQRLTSYQTDTSGNITGALGDLKLDTSALAPKASTAIKAVANLDATQAAIMSTFSRTDPTTYGNSTSLTVYDSLGDPIVATTYFRKTATANVWQAYTWITNKAGTSTEVLPTGLTAGNPATLTFSSSGALSSVAPAVGSTLAVSYQATSPGTGAANLSLSLDLTGTSQYGSAFSVNSLTQDGYASGNLSGVNIGDTGVVQARYTNGQSRTLGQIALANFSAPRGCSSSAIPVGPKPTNPAPPSWPRPAPPTWD